MRRQGRKKVDGACDMTVVRLQHEFRVAFCTNRACQVKYDRRPDLGNDPPALLEILKIGYVPVLGTRRMTRRPARGMHIPALHQKTVDQVKPEKSGAARHKAGIACHALQHWE